MSTIKTSIQIHKSKQDDCSKEKSKEQFEQMALKQDNHTNQGAIKQSENQQIQPQCNQNLQTQQKQCQLKDQNINNQLFHKLDEQSQQEQCFPITENITHSIQLTQPSKLQTQQMLYLFTSSRSNQQFQQLQNSYLKNSNQQAQQESKNVVPQSSDKEIQNLQNLDQQLQQEVHASISQTTIQKSQNSNLQTQSQQRDSNSENENQYAQYSQSQNLPASQDKNPSLIQNEQIQHLQNQNQQHSQQQALTIVQGSTNQQIQNHQIPIQQNQQELKIQQLTFENAELKIKLNGKEYQLKNAEAMIKNDQQLKLVNNYLINSDKSNESDYKKQLSQYQQVLEQKMKLHKEQQKKISVISQQQSTIHLTKRELKSYKQLKHEHLKDLKEKKKQIFLLQYEIKQIKTKNSRLDEQLQQKRRREQNTKDKEQQLKEQGKSIQNQKTMIQSQQNQMKILFQKNKDLESQLTRMSKNLLKDDDKQQVQKKGNDKKILGNEQSIELKRKIQNHQLNNVNLPNQDLINSNLQKNNVNLTNQDLINISFEILSEKLLSSKTNQTKDPQTSDIPLNNKELKVINLLSNENLLNAQANQIEEQLLNITNPQINQGIFELNWDILNEKPLNFQEQIDLSNQFQDEKSELINSQDSIDLNFLFSETKKQIIETKVQITNEEQNTVLPHLNQDSFDLNMQILNEELPNFENCEKFSFFNKLEQDEKSHKKDFDTSYNSINQKIQQNQNEQFEISQFKNESTDFLNGFSKIMQNLSSSHIKNVSATPIKQNLIQSNFKLRSKTNFKSPNPGQKLNKINDSKKQESVNKNQKIQNVNLINCRTTRRLSYQLPNQKENIEYPQTNQKQTDLKSQTPDAKNENKRVAQMVQVTQKQEIQNQEQSTLNINPTKKFVSPNIFFSSSQKNIVKKNENILKEKDQQYQLKGKILFASQSQEVIETLQQDHDQKKNLSNLNAQLNQSLIQKQNVIEEINRVNKIKYQDYEKIQQKLKELTSSNEYLNQSLRSKSVKIVDLYKQNAIKNQDYESISNQLKEITNLKIQLSKNLKKKQKQVDDLMQINQIKGKNEIQQKMNELIKTNAELEQIIEELNKSNQIKFQDYDRISRNEQTNELNKKLQQKQKDTDKFNESNQLKNLKNDEKQQQMRQLSNENNQQKQISDLNQANDIKSKKQIDLQGKQLINLNEILNQNLSFQQNQIESLIGVNSKKNTDFDLINQKFQEVNQNQIGKSNLTKDQTQQISQNEQQKLDYDEMQQRINELTEIQNQTQQQMKELINLNSQQKQTLRDSEQKVENLIQENSKQKQTHDEKINQINQSSIIQQNQKEDFNKADQIQNQGQKIKRLEELTKSNVSNDEVKQQIKGFFNENQLSNKKSINKQNKIEEMKNNQMKEQINQLLKENELLKQKYQDEKQNNENYQRNQQQQNNVADQTSNPQNLIEGKKDKIPSNNQQFCNQDPQKNIQSPQVIQQTQKKQNSISSENILSHSQVLKMKLKPIQNLNQSNSNKINPYNKLTQILTKEKNDLESKQINNLNEEIFNPLIQNQVDNTEFVLEIKNLKESIQNLKDTNTQQLSEINGLKNSNQIFIENYQQSMQKEREEISKQQNVLEDQKDEINQQQNDLKNKKDETIKKIEELTKIETELRNLNQINAIQSQDQQLNIKNSKEQIDKLEKLNQKMVVNIQENERMKKQKEEALIKLEQKEQNMTKKLSQEQQEIKKLNEKLEAEQNNLMRDKTNFQKELKQKRQEADDNLTIAKEEKKDYDLLKIEYQKKQKDFLVEKIQLEKQRESNQIEREELNKISYHQSESYQMRSLKLQGDEQNQQFRLNQIIIEEEIILRTKKNQDEKESAQSQKDKEQNQKQKEIDEQKEINEENKLNLIKQAEDLNKNFEEKELKLKQELDERNNQNIQAIEIIKNENLRIIENKEQKLKQEMEEKNQLNSITIENTFGQREKKIKEDEKNNSEKSNEINQQKNQNDLDLKKIKTEQLGLQKEKDSFKKYEEAKNKEISNQKAINVIENNSLKEQKQVLLTKKNRIDDLTTKNNQLMQLKDIFQMLEALNSQQQQIYEIKTQNSEYSQEIQNIQQENQSLIQSGNGIQKQISQIETQINEESQQIQKMQNENSHQLKATLDIQTYVGKQLNQIFGNKSDHNKQISNLDQLPDIFKIFQDVLKSIKLEINKFSQQISKIKSSQILKIKKSINQIKDDIVKLSPQKIGQIKDVSQPNIDKDILNPQEQLFQKKDILQQKELEQFKNQYNLSNIDKNTKDIEIKNVLQLMNPNSNITDEQISFGKDLAIINNNQPTSEQIKQMEIQNEKCQQILQNNFSIKDQIFQKNIETTAILQDYFQKIGIEVLMTEKVDGQLSDKQLIQNNYLFTGSHENGWYYTFDFPKQKDTSDSLQKGGINLLIQDLKQQIGDYLNIKQEIINDEIIVMDTHFNSSLSVDLQINNLTKEEFESLKQGFRFQNTPIFIKHLLKKAQISVDMFDEFYNSDYSNKKPSKNEYRGALPFKNKGYIPQAYNYPIGFKGYGLNVIDKYGDDIKWISKSKDISTWIVLYHGTSDEFVESIMVKNLKPGKRDLYENHKCRITQEKILPKNIYLADNISETERYCSEKAELNGKHYEVVFQCRVNPFGVQSPVDRPEYYTVQKSEDIRPCRILIKEIAIKKQDNQMLQKQKIFQISNVKKKNS